MMKKKDMLVAFGKIIFSSQLKISLSSARLNFYERKEDIQIFLESKSS
jgi:hypothetical protein